METLKWIRDNGGGWSSFAAINAAMNGHLETLKWIRANGGEWDEWAANWAANNGHLETLKWIRANGGEWSSFAADYAAMNGHLEIVEWVKYVDSGKWSEDLRETLHSEPYMIKDIENTIMSYVNA